MTFLKYKGLYLTLVIAFIILFLSLQPPGEEDPKLFVSDKVLHLFAYCLLVLPISLERIFSRFSVFNFALAYGGSVELIQPFWGREADIMDFFANAGGYHYRDFNCPELYIFFQASSATYTLTA